MLYSGAQLPENLYSVQMIRDAEARYLANDDIGLLDLISKAAEAAVELLRQKQKLNEYIVVFAGYGNNGADAYVCATLLLKAGVKVKLFALERPSVSPTITQVKAAFIAAGGDILTDYQEALAQADVVIDGLLGIGFNRAITEPFLSLLTAINHHKAWVLSLDVPSGINADTGAGDPAIIADITLTFGAVKQGLLTANARNCVGSLMVADIGLAPFLPAASAINIGIQLGDITLPARAKNSHKGSYGKVTVIGGEIGMAGAPRLAAEGCLRAGAGLVAVISRPDHLQVINSGRPELMFCGCQSIDSQVQRRLNWADILVIGPGLGQNDWGYQLLQAVYQTEKPCVIDADGLNLLAIEPKKNKNWVLTPHNGEAARLLNTDIATIENDRFAAVIAIQAKYGGVVVLKGAGSLIYDGVTCHVAPVGNPGLATGGSGDVLGGVIGALLAQGFNLMAAASAAVVIHGMAADIAIKEGERGMLASDLFPHIRRLIDKI